MPRHRTCVHALIGGIHNILELELDRKFVSRARVRGREGTRLGCYSVPCCCGRLPVLRRRVSGISLGASVWALDGNRASQEKSPRVDDLQKISDGPEPEGHQCVACWGCVRNLGKMSIMKPDKPVSFCGGCGKHYDVGVRECPT